MIRHLSIALLFALVGVAPGEEKKPLKILFLGDNGHHRPYERYRQLLPVMAKRGIDITYTDKVESLNPKNLASFAGLIVYANTTKITPEQEKALVDYVEGGKGFIPLHCASYCFLNSQQYIDLVGAQFLRHGTGTFRTVIAERDHPIMKGFRSFESWDETYVHTKHNAKDRTVLEYREDRQGKEPWTWVRTQGKGRIFYTAWGHDERTWGHPGFQNLVERGIRWAVDADMTTVPVYVDRPEMTKKRDDVKPFDFVEAKLPFYPSGRGSGKEEPFTKMQLPIDPAESMKHMIHPTDFEVKLFVSEDQLGGGKPMCMNWDERGRLWVALTVDYPNEKQREGNGRDRIVICEDTNGDGAADKVTVFADKLSIPTSLIFANGGVIVHQAPETLFLKDTDGDDKADVRKVMFRGWSVGDTHAGPSNLRYGFDNWLYGMVGYAGFEGTVGETRHSFRTGFYRFKADGSKMEFLRNTNNNSWGVGFGEEGVLFGSTANGNPSVYLPIPNRYYESVRGWSSKVLGTIAVDDRFYPVTEKVRQVDFHGRFTAAAGHALYTARTYPREYWNRTAFVTEPTGHLVATFVIQKNGSDFASRNSWNLLASHDEWTAPTMAEVGPDGNVWVIDWYNYIVQHNPTPVGFRTGKGNAYETNLRDKKHGRIYRLVHKNGKSDRPLSLSTNTPATLLAGLSHSNLFWRQHAQRLLVERGKTDVVPALIELAGDTKVDDIGLNPGVIHALWTLHGLGALDGKNEKATAVAFSSLKHPSAGVRRNAVQVLPTGEKSVQAIINSGALTDDDAQVRLTALLALAEQPASHEAGKALVQFLSDETNLRDRWLVEAATSAAAAHDLPFLSAVIAAGKPIAEHKDALTVVRIVAEHHARGGPVDSISKLLTSLGNPPQPITEAVIAGLERGWPRSRTATFTKEEEKKLASLLPSVSVSVRGQLVRLAERLGSQGLQTHSAEIAASLLTLVRDEKKADSERVAAAVQMVEFRRNDVAVVQEILKLVTPTSTPDLARGLVEAIGQSEATEAGAALVEKLPQLTPAVRPAVLRVALSRSTWTKTLLDAIDQGTVSLRDLSLDQQRALAVHPDRALAQQAKKLLERGGSLPSADRQKVIDKLLPLTKAKGDPVAGKLVYKNQCAKCHIHSGEGTAIGPDLTGMAVHPKEELLVQIMDPSRSVEGNFRIWRITLTSGKILSGLLASETKTSLEVIDAEAKKHTVLREDVEELQASPKSLMPEGFETQIKPEELTNLLAFLTQRGKYVPIPLDKFATITSVRGMFFTEDSTIERLIFDNWGPKQFEGVPFQLVDPKDGKASNVILLNGPQGTQAPKMPKAVMLPCNMPAKSIHFLSGISGWGHPIGRRGSVSMIVRLHYADGKTEDHELKNGEHFADYIRRVDVPQSKFAFALRDQQVRYLSVQPQREEIIKSIELVKGSDATAPVVMAVTIESR